MEPEHLRLIEEGAGAIGVRLARDQVALLARHVDLLLRWNRSINLTAITDPAEVVEKHVLDSLALVPLLPAGTLLDAGSGAGFPGIPLRIARPETEVVLVDSVQKKVAFLKSVIAELRLSGTRAVAVRLRGDPGEEHLPRVHAAVSRALASFPAASSSACSAPPIPCRPLPAIWSCSGSSPTGCRCRGRSGDWRSSSARLDWRAPEMGDTHWSIVRRVRDRVRHAEGRAPQAAAIAPLVGVARDR